MLFPQLLGAQFEELPATVRALHTRAPAHRYTGEVEVKRGRGGLSRLCAWVTQLPPAGVGAIAVNIAAGEAREQWTRHVQGRAMRSVLWAAQGRLCERLGLVTFGFQLNIKEGSIVWRAVRVRALGLPLPARWFAGVRAREFEHDGRYGFDVKAHLPLAGLLVHYRGWLDVG